MARSSGKSPPWTCQTPTEAPTPTSIASYEAVQLFVVRGAAARAGFALTDANADAVARICRGLDGVPLALELAAARLRALSPEQITSRLQNRFGLLTGGPRTAQSRHRSLAAAVTWSHDLLDQDERALFRRLSVFAGGWTLEAAEAICDSGSERDGHVLDTLARLVDRSLVLALETNGAVRYRY